jgi:SAM-dependent methyltransferase
MSHQGNIWDKEYNNPSFVTKHDEPQADTKRFLKFLKKEEKYKVQDKTILDLGSGTGRNSNYLAELGNEVIGIEISKNALEIAKARSDLGRSGLSVDYRLGDIGEKYDIPDNSIDIVLDVTSSNSLSEVGREIYLKEVNRVLKNGGPRLAEASGGGGYFFVRALAKDGNKNVKNLLKLSPGPEYDTYTIKEIGLTERVFSREDFVKMYSQYFKILHLEKKTNYATFNNRIYKRDYWLAYMTK